MNTPKRYRLYGEEKTIDEWIDILPFMRGKDFSDSKYRFEEILPPQPEAVKDYEILEDGYIGEGSFKQILSVKRISDGEVFTVRGYANIRHHDKTHKIKSFYTEGQKMIVVFDDEINGYEDGVVNILYLEKTPSQPKALFTTEDGVEIFHNQDYWHIVSDGTPQKETAQEYGREQYKKQSIRRFSTKEAAEAYIKANKPQEEHHKCKYCGEMVTGGDDEGCYANPKNKPQPQESFTWDEIEKALSEFEDVVTDFDFIKYDLQRYLKQSKSSPQPISFQRVKGGEEFKMPMNTKVEFYEHQPKEEQPIPLAPITPESYDGKKFDKISFDEIGQYEQPKERVEVSDLEICGGGSFNHPHHRSYRFRTTNEINKKYFPEVEKNIERILNNDDKTGHRLVYEKMNNLEYTQDQYNKAIAEAIKKEREVDGWKLRYTEEEMNAAITEWATKGFNAARNWDFRNPVGVIVRDGYPKNEMLYPFVHKTAEDYLKTINHLSGNTKK
jgi:hypothetical protein